MEILRKSNHRKIARSTVFDISINYWNHFSVGFNYWKFLAWVLGILTMGCSASLCCSPLHLRFSSEGVGLRSQITTLRACARTYQMRWRIERPNQCFKYLILGVFMCLLCIKSACLFSVLGSQFLLLTCLSVRETQPVPLDIIVQEGEI